MKDLSLTEFLLAIEWRMVLEAYPFEQAFIDAMQEHLELYRHQYSEVLSQKID